MEEQITTVQKLINTAIEFCVNYSFQVFGAIIILIVGVLIANWVAKLLMALFAKNKLDITLQEFGDSSINVGYRYWIPTAKYFQLMTAINLAIYRAIQQSGLSMPYPQMEVRMVKESV